MIAATLLVQHYGIRRRGEAELVGWATLQIHKYVSQLAIDYEKIIRALVTGS